MRPDEQKIACKAESWNVEQAEQIDQSGGHNQTDEHEQKIETVEPSRKLVRIGRHGFWTGLNQLSWSRSSV